MWPIAGVLAIGVAFMFIEVPALLKKKQRKDLWVFSILLLFGIALNIMEILEMPIPNPLEGITAIFRPFSHMMQGIFK